MGHNVFTVFTAAPHGDVLALLFQIATLLFFARLFGEVALRLGQPSVVGEIMAGIFLGPSLVKHYFPTLAAFVTPSNPTQGYLLEATSMLGALFLLLITGLEMDINLIRRQAKTAVGTAIGGLILPFASGFILGQWIPTFLLTNESHRFIFSLFIATSMSISAIPVISKVLIEMKLIRRDIGQTTIAAGMIDDTTGWIILSIVAGLASGQSVSTLTIAQTIGKVFLFLVFSMVFGQWLIRQVFHFVQDRTLGADRLLTIIVVFMFLWAGLTQSLHLEPVLGALVMGILIGQIPRLPQKIHEELKSLTFGIFAPIFFAVAGLKVNVINLFTPSLLWVTAMVFVIACLGKIIGAYMGARLVGRQEPWTALSLGIALNARGAMGIIVATIGLSLGILSQEMFSIVVLMAVLTSLITPLLLRWVLRHIKPSEEELKRLKHEESVKDSLVENIHRVLIPVRKRESEDIDVLQAIEMRILNMLGQKEKLAITLLTLDDPRYKNGNLKFLDKFANYFKDHEVAKRFIDHKDNPKVVIHTILDEAKKYYDLLVLGATQVGNSSEYVFSKTIDPLVGLSPCMTMVVSGQNVPVHWTPRRILVPTNGSAASRHAAELAFSLVSAPPIEGKVHIVNVIEKNMNVEYYIDTEILDNQRKMFAEIVKELKDIGKARGVYADTSVKIGQDLESAIFEIVSEEKMDLIILGTSVHTTSGRLFLGPRVENILKNSPCPVIILNSF